MKIPDYKEALFFSFENNPEESLKHTKNQLPFGCHAWDLHLNFWRPHFEKYGYFLPAHSNRDFN
nr:DUF5672 family protein [Dyadobacter sp. NIV53]